MKKTIIGLDVDEIFRSYIETFHYFYEKEFNMTKFDLFGDRVDGYNCKYSTNKLNEIFEFKEINRRTKLLVSDIDVVYSSHPKFENEEQIISKEMAFNVFRYEDYLMELYGTTPKTYTHVGLDLAKLVDKYEHDVIFKFIIKDNTITIAPTLFFLSTLRPTIKDYHFVNKIEDVWNLCDYYITANPDYLHDMQGKIIVKNMDYNKDYEIENRIDHLGDLLVNNIIDKFI